jgi:hypothetical protein
VLATVAPVAKVQEARWVASGSAATGDGHVAPLDDDAVLDAPLDPLLDAVVDPLLDAVVDALLDAPPPAPLVEVLAPPPAPPVLAALVLEPPPLPLPVGPAPDGIVCEDECVPEPPHACIAAIAKSTSAVDPS